MAWESKQLLHSCLPVRSSNWNKTNNCMLPCHPSTANVHSQLHLLFFKFWFFCSYSCLFFRCHVMISWEMARRCVQSRFHLFPLIRQFGLQISLFYHIYLLTSIHAFCVYVLRPKDKWIHGRTPVLIDKWRPVNRSPFAHLPLWASVFKLTHGLISICILFWVKVRRKKIRNRPVSFSFICIIM